MAIVIFFKPVTSKSSITVVENVFNGY